MAAVAGMSSATVAFAQRVDDKYVESDVVPLAGKEGFSFQTRAGDFLFKPYSLIQVAGKFNYYDDENLNLAEWQKSTAWQTAVLPFRMPS